VCVTGVMQFVLHTAARMGLCCIANEQSAASAKGEVWWRGEHIAIKFTITGRVLGADR
jgi:hypothetical protein